MPFSSEIRERVLVESARCCCVCQRYRGVKVEIHHIVPEAKSKDNTYENAISLCFDCHYEAGHYNDQHPKGVKFSPSELRKHREQWKNIVRDGKVVLSSAENNQIHVQFFACMDFEVAKEVCSKNLKSLPLKNAILFSNQVLAYQSDLIDRMAVGLYRNFRYYANESEFLTINPEAVRNSNDYPSFAFSRRFNEKRDQQYLNISELKLFDYYLKGGLKYEDFISLNSYHPTEGCGDDYNYNEELHETIGIKKPFYFYLAVTNLHSKSIQLDSFEFKRFGQEEMETAPFPPVLLQSGNSVVIPLGQFLEHGFDKENYEELETSPSYESAVVSYCNSYNKEAKFFGASIFPNLIRYKYEGSLFEFRPHDFDLNKVFYIDRIWFIGSCPHCFTKNDSDTYKYIGEILTKGQEKTDASELFFEAEVKELLIAEIEDETTFIQSIELNGKLLFSDIVLKKGNSVTITDIKKGDRVKIKGYYKPDGKAQTNLESLYRRNELVSCFLKQISDPGLPI